MLTNKITNMFGVGATGAGAGVGAASASATGVAGTGTQAAAQGGSGVMETVTGIAGAVGLGGTDIASAVLGEETVNGFIEQGQGLVDSGMQVAENAGLGDVASFGLGMFEQFSGIDVDGDGQTG